jgi:hypothetical protein
MSSINEDWGFPRIRELPPMRDTVGWSWIPFKPCRNAWLGKDPQGRSWLVKLRGKVGAINEHVYADFSQSLGICTQSSVFLVLDKGASPLHGDWHPDKLRLNVALWKYEEHGYDPCGPSCPYNKLRAPINDWPQLGFRNPWDKIEARFLGYLCGMFEPTQDLITTDHLWVQIDNELIFDQWAFERGKAYENVMNEVLKDGWLKIDGARSRIKTLCERITDLSEVEIQSIATVPDEYHARTYAARLNRYLRQTRRTASKISRAFS